MLYIYFGVAGSVLTMLFGYEDFNVSKLFITVLVSFWKAAKLAVQQRSEKSLQLLSLHIWISVILDSEGRKFTVLQLLISTHHTSHTSHIYQPQ